MTTNNIGMSLSVAGPELVVPYLADFMTECYGALDGGSSVARDLFKRLGRDPDPWVFADVVRMVTKDTLSDRYEMEFLPNNGLMTVVTGCTLRIRKSDAGDLPIPGKSRTLQMFYHQLQLGLDGETNARPNLLLLWDTEQDWSLSDVLLIAAPKAGDETRGSVDSHWTVVVSDRGRSSPFHGQGRSTIADLDIRLPAGRKTGNNAAG
jgi:hypothetical protein